jgi:hypothetical protein
MHRPNHRFLSSQTPDVYLKLFGILFLLTAMTLVVALTLALSQGG